MHDHTQVQQVDPGLELGTARVSTVLCMLVLAVWSFMLRGSRGIPCESCVQDWTQARARHRHAPTHAIPDHDVKEEYGPKVMNLSII
jgi:hypothetical protein